MNTLANAIASPVLIIQNAVVVHASKDNAPQVVLSCLELVKNAFTQHTVNLDDAAPIICANPLRQTACPSDSSHKALRNVAAKEWFQVYVSDLQLLKPHPAHSALIISNVPRDHVSKEDAGKASSRLKTSHPVNLLSI